MSNALHSKRQFKDRVFAQLERIGKALGSRRRLELLDVLSQGPHDVETLATELEISVASASQHLQKLHDANLVARRREGSHVYYHVASEDVGDFYATLRRIAESQLPALRAEVDDFFETPRVSTEDISALMDEIESGEAMLIDTRPRSEYEAGHVHGATSVPVTELSRLADELPRDRRLIAYCRGPYCTFADTTVQELRRKGFDAYRVDLGVADFRKHGAEIDAA